MKCCLVCSEQYFSKAKSRYVQFLAAFGANLGLISTGMQFGWSSNALPILTSGNYTFTISSEAGSWLSSMMSIGDIFGCLLAMVFVQKFGRRTNIILCALPLALSWILIALAGSEMLMFISRFLGGILDGVLFAVVPPYLSEIADPEIRGLLGTTSMVFLGFGMLLVNLLDLILPMTMVAYLAAAVSLSALLIMPFVPESPHYLQANNDAPGATKSLQKLRGRVDVEEELGSISAGSIQVRGDGTKLSDLFTNSVYRKSLLIAWGLNVLQYGTGHVALQAYCRTLFERSNWALAPSTANVVYFAVIFLATLVSPLVIDRAGRRPVILVSAVLSCLVMLGNGTYLFVRYLELNSTNSFDLVQLVLLSCFSISHSTGLQTIPMLVTSEIFPTNLRSFVLCLLNINFGVVSTAAIVFFNAALETFGLYVAFWSYGGLLAIGIIFIAFCMPETKQKTLESIQLELKSWQFGNQSKYIAENSFSNNHSKE